MPLTAVNISLGIFTRKAREKEHFWRAIGYMPSFMEENAQGLRELVEADHVESAVYSHKIGEHGGQKKDNSQGKVHDLHAMLDVIFAHYAKLQETGFVWDLFYQNELIEDVQFVLFTPFMKLDTAEAEQLCGKYGSRSGNVKCICRYCECPTDEADDPFAEYRLKKMANIQRLVDNNDLEALKEVSQQNIQNACYKLRFGSHNTVGVHGACPMEMLHQILLGAFKYARE